MTEPAFKSDEIIDLRNALADVLANHGERGTGCWCGGTEWEGDYDCHLADIILKFLGLHREWGALDENNDGVITETREELKDTYGGTVKSRYATDWKEEDETA